MMHWASEQTKERELSAIFPFKWRGTKRTGKKLAWTWTRWGT